MRNKLRVSRYFTFDNPTILTCECSINPPTKVSTPLKFPSSGANAKRFIRTNSPWYRPPGQVFGAVL